MENFTLPSDFTTKLQQLLRTEWDAFLKSYETNKYQGIRFNPLKKGFLPQNLDAVLDTLCIQEKEPIPWAANAFYYDENSHPGKHPYHEAGLYYIQEPSAMSAAALLAPTPGEYVLDLCAAPGGKSTQLASYLQQEGLLVANEIHPARCKILSQNIERLGIANAIVTNEDSSSLAKHFPEYFDKILVDAPCSGEGMFRKNPEAMAEWSLEQVLFCAARQSDILNNAAKMLKPGGTMVYSTCTFSPEENEGVIGTFLETHPDFSIVRQENSYFSSGNPQWGNHDPNLSHTFRLWPHKLHGEGHFAALLRKNGVAEDISHPSNKYKPDKKLLSLLSEFTSQTLKKEMEDFILSGNLTLFGEQLYRLPPNAPSLSGLKVLRAGLHIGTFKKNRFEPSHALALFLGKEDVRHFISFSADSAETAMYYRGETIPCDSEKGFCLFCVDDYSAGWGKISGGQIKNHYPKGLRK